MISVKMSIVFLIFSARKSILLVKKFNFRISELILSCFYTDFSILLCQIDKNRSCETRNVLKIDLRIFSDFPLDKSAFL